MWCHTVYCGLGAGGIMAPTMGLKPVVIFGGFNSHPLVSTHLPMPTNTCMSPWVCSPWDLFWHPLKDRSIKRSAVLKVQHSSCVRRSLLLVRTAVCNVKSLHVRKRRCPTFLPLIPVDTPEKLWFFHIPHGLVIACLLVWCCKCHSGRGETFIFFKFCGRWRATVPAMWG